MPLKVFLQHSYLNRHLKKIADMKSMIAFLVCNLLRVYKMNPKSETDAIKSESYSYKNWLIHDKTRSHVAIALVNASNVVLFFFNKFFCTKTAKRWTHPSHKNWAVDANSSVSITHSSTVN